MPQPPRKYLFPNNQNPMGLMAEFNKSKATHVNLTKSNQRPSIITHLRAGRQNSEGFGGSAGIPTI
jgi:hypothetical protein